MKITAEMFSTVCRKFRVPPKFLDLVRGMGYKSRSDDEHFMSCYCFVASDAESGADVLQGEGVASSTFVYSLGFGRTTTADTS